MRKNIVILIVSLSALSLPAQAQQVLTLDECRQLAVENSSSLKTAEEKVKISKYDQKIAAANYFPKVTASGTYMYAMRPCPRFPIWVPPFREI